MQKAAKKKDYPHSDMSNRTRFSQYSRNSKDSVRNYSTGKRTLYLQTLLHSVMWQLNILFQNKNKELKHSYSNNHIKAYSKNKNKREKNL